MEGSPSSILPTEVEHQSTGKSYRDLQLLRSLGKETVSGDHDRRLWTTLEECFTFKDSDELLRATTLTVAMRRGSHIFASSEGSSATYCLSKISDSIDVFLSHNWSTPRYTKFFTLAYEYNLHTAIWAMLFVCVVLTTISCCSAILEVPDMTVDENLGNRSVALGCKFVAVPVFFVALFFGHDLTKYFQRMAGPSLFLDKCCIDQVDREAQRRGISKLGAFLAKSQKMLVLFSDTYLQRLWTIYELASFLAIHDLDHLKIVPVFQPKTLFMLISYWWVYHVLITAVRVTQSFYYYMYLLSAMCGYAVMLCIRDWERDKAAVQERVAHFLVQDAVCAYETDRPLVYYNIQCLMQGTGLVKSGCTMNEALAAFNNLVRTILPSAMLTMGSRAFRLRDYLLFGFAADGVKLLDWFATLWCRGSSWRVILPEALYHVVWISCWPAIMAVSEVVCSYHTSIRGWREKVMVGFWLLIIVSICFVFNEFACFLMVDARDSDLSMFGMISITVLTSTLCLALCRGRRRPAAPKLDLIRRSVADSISTEGREVGAWSSDLEFEDMDSVHKLEDDQVSDRSEVDLEAICI